MITLQNIPENISVEIMHDKEFEVDPVTGLNGRCIKYDTYCTLINNLNGEIVGHGVSMCNVNVDNPCKKHGRNKAIGRAIKAWLSK